MKTLSITTGALSALILGSFWISATLAAETSSPAWEPVMVVPEELTWSDVASLPKGAKMAVIAGNLKEAVPFIVRFKFPADYQVAPHTHPATENVTVISGTIYFGAGEEADPEKAQKLPPGSVAVMPSGVPMFGWTKDEEAIIQVHGIGPWGITYLNPEDDPRKK